MMILCVKIKTLEKKLSFAQQNMDYWKFTMETILGAKREVDYTVPQLVALLA